MTKQFILSILFIVMSAALWAQAPEQFNFQAVARDAAGNPYTSANLAVRISLVRGGASGLVDYSERHVIVTSSLGVFNMIIGDGDILNGTMANVNWANDAYYLKIDIDPNGGTNYINLGSSQLLSVPYAIYAGESGSGGGGTDSQTLSYDPATQQLSISNGNDVFLPAGEQGADGAMGEQGIQGEAGITGEQGEQGEQGIAGTGISLLGNVATVGDLPAGANNGDLYIVQADGDGYAWDGSMWNNVGAIQGPQGEAGADGEQGIPGEQGEAGAMGEQGTQGESGEAGPVGEQGIPGEVGSPGEQGIAGTGISLLGNVATVGDLPVGANNGDLYIVEADGDGYAWDGSMWNNVGPIQGPQGEAGAAGEQGIQGEVGTAGAMGEQGIQGETGEVGSVGEQGIQGETGPQGEQGIAGTGISLLGNVATVGDLPAGANNGDLYIVQADGNGYAWDGSMWNNVGPIQGPQGEAGATGEQGIQGEAGTAGVMGEQGTQGEQGLQGESGEQGIPGEQGEPGTSGSYTAGDGINIVGDQISANDTSPTNEIQTLELLGTNLSLSNDGGSVNLSNLPTNITLPYYDQANQPTALFHIHNENINSRFGLVGTTGAGAATLPSNSAGVLGIGHLAHGVLGIAKINFLSGVYGISESPTGRGVSGYGHGGGIGGHFYTTPWGRAALTTGDGRVGLGTLDPTDKVEIKDEEKTRLSLNGEESGGVSSLLFRRDLDDTHKWGWLWEASMTEDADSSSMTLYDYNYEEGGDFWSENRTAVYSLLQTNFGEGNYYLHQWQGQARFDYDNNDHIGLTTGLGKIGLGTHNPTDKVEIKDEEETRLSLNGEESGGVSSLLFRRDLDNNHNWGWLWEASMTEDADSSSMTLYDYSYEEGGDLWSENRTAVYSLLHQNYSDGDSYLHNWNGQGVFENNNLYAPVLFIRNEFGMGLNIETTSIYDGPQLELKQTGLDYARMNFTNTTSSAQWQIAARGSDGTDQIEGVNDSKMLFYFSNDSSAGSILAITASRKMGIGNSNPDETLVIGSSLGRNWGIPAATIGNDIGGGLTIGTPDITLDVECSTLLGAKITSSDDNGIGQGKIRISTRQLTLGVSNIGIPNPRTYPLRVIQNTSATGGDFGLNLINGSDPAKNWEIRVLNDAYLGLFMNNSYRGVFNATNGNYSPTSDARLKTNIQKLENVLPLLQQLEAKRYEYKSNRGEFYNGFLAQDIQPLFPEIVTEVKAENEGEEDTLLVDYSQLAVLAIAAVNELTEQVDEQASEIETLKAQHQADMEAMDARLEALEALLLKD